MKFGLAVALEYIIEFVLLVTFGLVISGGTVNFNVNLKHIIYYLFAFVILLPYIGFLLKERKRILTPFLKFEGWILHFDWMVFVGLLAPFFPLFIFVVLVKMHLDFFIVPTVLAILIAIPSSFIFFIVIMLSIFPGLKNFGGIQNALKNPSLYFAILIVSLALFSSYVFLSHYTLVVAGLVLSAIAMFFGNYGKGKGKDIEFISAISFIFFIFAIVISVLLSNKTSLFSLNFISALGIETLFVLLGFLFFYLDVVFIICTLTNCWQVLGKIKNVKKS